MNKVQKQIWNSCFVKGIQSLVIRANSANGIIENSTPAAWLPAKSMFDRNPGSDKKHKNTKSIHPYGVALRLYVLIIASHVQLNQPRKYLKFL